MRQAKDQDQIRSVTRRWRQEGQTIALVPTMGNLHDGHLALVRAAGLEADRVVTSIYVNPAQFGEGEDFESYPRTLDADRESLEQAGCDLLFIPDHHTMYPYGLGNAVRLLAPPDLAALLEGKSRPGHFDGVVTVVARLFNLVDPDIAVFGEKDYQQLLVIKRLVDDLGFGIRIVPVPTVREASGLAMSSRNNYLEPAQRKAAGELNAVLRQAAERIKREPGQTTRVERAAVLRLERLGFRVEYVAIRRAEDLAVPAAADQKLRVLAAAWSGQTRLIDNIGIIRVGI
jgi:pantoate--beta-alanine ligase